MWVLTLLLPLATTGSAAESDYVASIEAWRQQFDADLRTGGVLLLIGRFKLEEGSVTLGSGRFLHAPLPQGGATELDFNKAFNPYCAVNMYVACAVPPPQNRLAVAVEAGEKYRASGE